VAKRPAEIVAVRVKEARNAHKWLQTDLVKRLEELGAHGWRQSKIAKLERGEIKRLTLEETLELAAALGVKPTHLLAGDEEIAITPKLVTSGADVREWIAGRRPLVKDAAWTLALLSREERESLMRSLREAGYEPSGDGDELLFTRDAILVKEERSDG